MVIIKKINKIVWLFSLIAVLTVLVNNTLFVHIHILPDGRVIEHAHPYKTSDKNSAPQSNHHHTSQEFLLLSHIYHLFSKAYTLFIVMLFLGRFFCKYYPPESKTSYSVSKKRVKSSRAPPQLLLFL